MAKLTALFCLLLLLGSAYALEFKEAQLTKYEEVSKDGLTIRLEAEEYYTIIYPEYARHYYRLQITNTLALAKNSGSVGGKVDAWLKSGGEVSNLQYYEYTGKTEKGVAYLDSAFKSLALSAGATKEYIISVDTPPLTEGKFNFTLTLDGVDYFFDPTISACGALAASTTYTLTSNLKINLTGNCFTTSGVNVVFDGQGYTLDSGGWVGTAAFFASFSGFTLRNIVTSNWGTGFTSTADTVSIQNFTAYNCSTAGVYHSIAGAVTNGIYVNNAVIMSNGTYRDNGIWTEYTTPALSAKAVIANTTINTKGVGILLNKTNATISHLNTNTSILLDTTVIYANATLWNVTAQDYSLFTVIANKPLEYFYNDIVNSSAILIKGYDHGTNYKIPYVNITLYNTSGTYSYPNRYCYMQDYRYLAGTFSTLKLEENVNYYPGYVLLDQSYLNGSQYLLLMLNKSATDNVLISFYIQDELGNALPNATLTLFKTVGSSPWLVSAQRTEITGVLPFYLQLSAPYRLVVNATGYNTIDTIYAPSTLTSVVIKLRRTGSSSAVLPNFEQVFNDVYYSLTPHDYYNVNWTLVNYTVFSNSSNLTYFGMLVKRYWNNTITTVFNSTNTTSPSGGTMLYNASQVGTYTINIFFKHNNFSEYAPMARSFVVVNASTGGSQAAQLLATGFISGWAFYFIAVVCAALAGGYATRFAPEAAGVIAILVLWGFTYLYPWGIIVTLGSVGVSILMATIFSTLMVGAALVLKWWG